MSTNEPIETTLGARRLPTFRQMAARATPALAVVVAIALWVTAVPSRQPADDATDVDLFGPSGRSASGGAAADGEGGTAAAGATDPAAVSAGAAAGPGAAGVAAVGSRRTGVTAMLGFDCSRNRISRGRSCRPAKFTGSNGGATFRGVTGDKIRVVAYQVKQNEQVQAILSTAGTANDAQRKGALEAIVKWVNQNFELYGRTIEPVYWVGTTPANDPAGQQADAVHVAEELDAFAVLSLYPAPIFHEELHRRRVLNFAWNQFPQSFYEKVSPHTFGLFPDTDLLLAHQAEYWCKRLKGGNAVHAGTPNYQTSARNFGIIYQDATDNGPVLEALVKRRCGITVAKTVSYPPDIGNAAAISTNVVTQMQQAGVTTVTCLCDVIAPVFFTGQATKQGWYPEWIHNGFFVTDANAAGRLYEPTQWSHSFGPSSLAYPTLTAEIAGYRVCRAGGGAKDHCVKGQASYYAFLAMLANTLEANGPKVTDLAVATKIVNLPPLIGEEPSDPQFSFGNNGPGPYTYIDNFMEIWYSPTRQGPDGKNGTAVYVDGGRRYLLGAWPSTPPRVFVDDGSRQPPRDPDLG